MTAGGTQTKKEAAAPNASGWQPFFSGPAVFLCLLVLVVTAYRATFDYGFVAYDDERIILQQAGRYNGFSAESLRRVLVTDFPREEPLIVRDLSYQLNAALFGPENPGGYHLANVLLHAAVAFFVFLTLGRLFIDRKDIAFLGAVLFAVHPLQSESVAWISGRKELLYVFFLLAAFLSYLRALTKDLWQDWLAVLLFFCLSLLSKAAAISFVPLIFCYRMTLGRDRKTGRREALFLALAVLATVVFVWWYHGQLYDYGVFSRKVEGSRDWASWLVFVPAALGFYLQKLVLPLDLRAVYVYPAPQILFTRPLHLLLSLFLVAATALALYFWRRQKDRRALFLAAWFCCGLLPYMDLARVGIFVAERYAYLSSIPFAAGAAWLFFAGVARLRPAQTVARVAAILLLVMLVAAAWQQSRLAAAVWRDSLTLWENVRQQTPEHLASYPAIMGEYLKRYRQTADPAAGKEILAQARQVGDDAIRRFSYKGNRYERALYLVTVQMGQIAWYEGQPERADRFFRLSLQLAPAFLKGRLIYASFLAQGQRRREALAQLRFIGKNAHPLLDAPVLSAAVAMEQKLSVDSGRR